MPDKSLYSLKKISLSLNAERWCLVDGAKDVISSIMAGMQQKFKNHVTDLVLRLEDLGFFQNRGELPKNKLEALLKGTIHDSEWPKVLFKLTEILHVLHEEKVVILIDEYDILQTTRLFSWGVFELRTHNIYVSFPSQANEFFCEVFSKLLKVSVFCVDGLEHTHQEYPTNKHVRGAMLVGILCITKVDLLSGVDNISDRFCFIYFIPRRHLLSNISFGSDNQVLYGLHVHGARG